MYLHDDEKTTAFFSGRFFAIFSVNNVGLSSRLL